jgi:hypothetical protein
MAGAGERFLVRRIYVNTVGHPENRTSAQSDSSQTIETGFVNKKYEMVYSKDSKGDEMVYFF